MTDPIPVNLAAIEQRAGQKLARQEEALQVASQDRFIEDVERGFNPAAAERQQARQGRFRTLESRKKAAEKAESKIEAVEKKAEEDLAQNYNRRNPELPASRLRQLRDNLRSGQSAEKVLQEVNDAFEDPTLADEALEYLEKQTTGSLQENVRTARNLLNELKGREVIAGRNIDSAAKSYHRQGLGQSATQLRNLYRDITGNPREHNALFSQLSEKYPFDQLKMVVAFLLKGMAYDLKSKGPSIQAAELMRLMTETRNLQSILWVYLFFKGRMGLLKSLYNQYGLPFSDSLSFEKLAKDFIKLVDEKYPSAMKLLKQAEKLGLTDDLQKIAVLMQYRDAIRGLSPRLYKTMRHRQELLMVILETLDELEDRGEEEE
ncbi:type III secretion system gatekeeper subunit SctW [Chlamydiota bacterium]